MFDPINKDGDSIEDQGSDLEKYLHAIGSLSDVCIVEEVSYSSHEHGMSEYEEKLLFNKIMKCDINSLDIERMSKVLLNSDKLYFLVIEKLMDAGKIILSTKMLNFARAMDIMPNKYFFLRRVLKKHQNAYFKRKRSPWFH